MAQYKSLRNWKLHLQQTNIKSGEYMMSVKLIGVDLGTGGCKATVIDDTGKMLASAYKEYPSQHRFQGWSEQHPDLWIDAFIFTIKECAKRLGNFEYLKGIAFSASTHNAVLLDKTKKIIRPTIMWNDQRSADQCKKLLGKHGNLFYKIGMQVPTPTWTLPQLMWIKENEPNNYAKIDQILFTKDYVRSFVTGDRYTDIVDAQGSLLFDANKREWSKKICDTINLPIEVLPEVMSSTEIVGTVTRRIYELTGLPEGTPVITGCSDTAAEDYGAGAVQEGQLIVKLATAGNVNIISNSARPNNKTYTYPYAIRDMWYSVTGTNSSAASYRWLRDAFYTTEKVESEAKGEDVYLLMDKYASEIDLGSGGLIFHPYLIGERCPYFNPKLKSNFFGMTISHDRRHFTRAVLEGVAFSLYDCFLVLRKFNKDIKDIRIIGGGAKSPLWCQIVSDVFGLEVILPLTAESSFGGALLAGVGVGAFDDELSAVEKCVRIKRSYKPNMENHEKYKKLFNIYKKITLSLEKTWEEFHEIYKEF